MNEGREEGINVCMNGWMNGRSGCGLNRVRVRVERGRYI